MSVMTAQELHAIYRYVVVQRAVSDVARLLAAEGQQELVASDWYRRVRPGQQRSILDLEGLGAEIWVGVDAKQYVDGLRDEWDHR